MLILFLYLLLYNLDTKRTEHATGQFFVTKHALLGVCSFCKFLRLRKSFSVNNLV